jgi:hypothetical protein
VDFERLVERVADPETEADLDRVPVFVELAESVTDLEAPALKDAERLLDTDRVEDPVAVPDALVLGDRLEVAEPVLVRV